MKDVPVVYKMEAVVLLIGFENMIKKFLKNVDGKRKCYFRILNLNKLKYCLSTKKKDLCKRNLQIETSFDASCLQCLEYIGYSNKNGKVIYKSAI